MPAPLDDTDRVPREPILRDRRTRARLGRRSQSLVVVLAIVAGLIAAALGTRPDEEAKALSRSTATTVNQGVGLPKTVLFAHVNAERRLDLLFVAGIHPGGEVGSVVFVPPTTLVHVPAFSTQALIDLPKLGSSTLLATTVGNALGIRFNQVTFIGDERLAQMLAPAKRFDVAFGRSVQVDDSAGTLAFTRGRAHISAGDATRLLIGDDPAGDLEHLVTVQAVLQGWFSRLKNDPAVARATVEETSHARNLVALARTDIAFDTLPVDVLSSGSIARYEMRQPDADELVRAEFPWALFTTGKRLRVEVLNGTGAIALTQAVARKVVPAGGEITLTGNVPGFGVRRTQVVYYRSADEPAARRLAAALGVGSVALGNVPLDVIDLSVVVGSDFKIRR